jgi:DNA-binding response OmpR family regulator
MPRLDGRGLLRRVRSLLPGTPVILVSGRGEAEAVPFRDGGGASAYLPKPLELDALLARIRELIGR